LRPCCNSQHREAVAVGVEGLRVGAGQVFLEVSEAIAVRVGGGIAGIEGSRRWGHFPVVGHAVVIFIGDAG